MQCESDRNLFLLEPRQGQADPELVNHLASCPSCSRQWESLQRALTVLGQAGDATPPAAFSDLVMARIASESRGYVADRARAANFTLLASVLALAGAGVVGVVVAGSVLGDVINSPGTLLVGALLAAASWANGLLTLLAIARALLVAARVVPPEVAVAGCVCLFSLVGGSVAIWTRRFVPTAVGPSTVP